MTAIGGDAALAPDWQKRLRATIEPALARSQSIRALAIDRNALAQIPALLREHFEFGEVLLVADENTMAAAGDKVSAILSAAGLAYGLQVFPGTPRLKASVENAREIIARLDGPATVPLVVGAGVLTDLAKYAAHRAERPYFSVATAASMDGYASAGAPLSEDGFKHTIACAPPRVMLADLDVIAAAPSEMTGWGYGDLAGKLPAGADWILADALGVEPIDAVAWPLVQDNLRDWLAAAPGLAAGKPEALAGLFAGLVLSGLSMEFYGSSRPASGADHQIAHLWEMEGLTHAGEPVSHGACVALGSLAVLSLYDWLLAQDLAALGAAALVAGRQTLAAKEAAILARFGEGTIATRAVEETRAKFVDDTTLEHRLESLLGDWPALRVRLEGFLMPMRRLRALLDRVGAVTDPARRGVRPDQLRDSLLSARYIRRRYTVLDLLEEIGKLDEAVEAAVAALYAGSKAADGEVRERTVS